MKQPIALRAVVPCAVASVVVLALGALYGLGYHGLYHALLENWGAHPFRFPFLDTHSVLSAIECHRRGIDVYVENPCDVLDRVHVYSPLWLRVGVLPVTTSWTTAVGLAIVVLFLSSLRFLPPGRSWRETMLITLGAVSSMVVYAVKRANIDIIMFLLAMLAARLALRTPWLRLLGYIVALFAGMLKFYPTTLLILAVRERLATAATIALVALAALSLWFALEADELIRVLSSIPTTSYFGVIFGARDLPYGLAETFGWSPGVAAGLQIALFLSILVAAPMLASREKLRTRVARLTEAEATFLLVGCVLMLGCCATAQNGLYRGIHFLLMLPALAALFGGTCGMVLFLMWGEAIRQLLGHLVTWLGSSARAGVMVDFVFWLARELVWWALVATLAALLISLPARSRAGLDLVGLVRRAAAAENRFRPKNVP